MGETAALERFKQSFLARFPLVFVVCSEDERVERHIRSFSNRVVRDRTLEVTLWSCVSGFSSEARGEEPTTDPLTALTTVFSSREPGLFIFQDLGAFFDDPRVRRALREGYQKLKGSGRTVFISGAELVMPQDLERQMHVIDLGLPSTQELENLVQSFRKSASAIQELWVEEIAFALKGLTLSEAGHCLQRTLRQGTKDLGGFVREVSLDKSEAVRRAGFLEYFPQQEGIEGIGGLENLKDWLRRREKLFQRSAIEDGMPVPKGMLIMGMSGCGKSLAAKSVSALWRTPLFRLDMNLIVSGIYGTPEAAFARALRTIENLAPAILWIDEIENSLGGEGDGGAGNAGIFSSFLTWMQEKPPLIFVAATANRINALPAEVIRKGRFDQVFFVDLPTMKERQQIFEIHLRRNDANLKNFDLELLSIATRGWNGAEIEEAVKAARIDAYQVGRPFVMADLTRNTSVLVPLSKTMHEQMKRIRGWAYGRATLASAEEYRETETGALG